MSYAICEDCKQEMNPGVACTVTHVLINSETFKRLAYQNDCRPESHNCHDCNAPLGGLHHGGCDMETCPKCGGQLISCGCGVVNWVAAKPVASMTGGER